jgi:hypothetical protein
LSVEKERLTSEWEVMLKERQAAMEYEQLKALDMTKNFADKLEKEIEKLKLKEEEVQKVEQQVLLLFCDILCLITFHLVQKTKQAVGRQAV